MAVEYNVDDFIFDHAQDTVYKKLRCGICSKEFMFRMSQTEMALAIKIPMPEYCDECVKKMEKALQERNMCVPKHLAGNAFGGLMGNIGGEAAMSTTAASAFFNPYAQGTMDQLAYLQAQSQLQSLMPPDVKAAILKSEEPKIAKEAPKIELNPKRAVQLEE